jgi:general secretion pathway protein J
MNRQIGLTLIELLIAMAISALIAVASYRLFSTSVQTKESIEIQSTIFTELARSFNVIERDFSQLAPYRKVRTPFGEYKDFLSLDYEGLQLTRNGWAISQYQTYQRSTLQRVQYRLAERGSEVCEYDTQNDSNDGPCFIRSFTAQLDDDGSFSWRHQILSEQVKTIEWRFLILDSATGESQFETSLPESITNSDPQLLIVEAIELTLNLIDGRQFRRLIPTPKLVDESIAGDSNA